MAQSFTLSKREELISLYEPKVSILQISLQQGLIMVQLKYLLSITNATAIDTIKPHFDNCGCKRTYYKAINRLKT